MWLNKLDSKTCAGHLGLFWRIVMAVLILLESNGMTWDFIKCFVIKKILGLQGKTGDSYSDKIEKMYFLLLVSSVLLIVLKCSTSSCPSYTLYNFSESWKDFCFFFFLFYVIFDYVLFLWLIFITIPRNRNLAGGVIFDTLHFIDTVTLSS